ncbi:MAG: alanine racemase [Bermanella sp.]|jgi:alanine racemase
MARATQAIINLHALRENYQLAKKCAANSRAYAVIKANAYGHGVLPVANALSAMADGFAVACIEEALELRQGGILLPILVLEGAMDEQECQVALDLDLELVVHQSQQVRWLDNKLGSLRIWIKVDSGMHRLGFAGTEVPALVSELRNMACVSQVQLLSHFACADEVGHPFNEQQLQQIQILSPMKLPWSMSNSAAILSMPEAHGDLVRPGLMLFGASPLSGRAAGDLQLANVMTLQSRVIALHAIGAGESVGYGQAFVAKQDTSIAVVAIGYGDGYPRSARPGTPVVIAGQECPLVGRVSMDMITVDVSRCQVKLGDTATLWGVGLSVDEVAKCCATLSYELFCQLTQRVKFQYLGR